MDSLHQEMSLVQSILNFIILYEFKIKMTQLALSITVEDFTEGAVEQWSPTFGSFKMFMV